MGFRVLIGLNGWLPFSNENRVDQIEPGLGLVAGHSGLFSKNIKERLEKFWFGLIQRSGAVLWRDSLCRRDSGGNSGGLEGRF